MFIERVQVEEGFLDGLDLKLTHGLNVIIGARGTGKTSLIELIRFCLGVRGHTTDSDRRARDHAQSVLADGQVTVTLNVNGQSIVVTRSTVEETPRSSGTYAPPMVFAQTEIENVGLSASGRLRLLDSFISGRARLTKSENAAIAEIKSFSAEVLTNRQQLAQLQEQVRPLADVEKQITEIEQKEREVTTASADVAKKKTLLDDLTKKLSELAVSTSYLTRFSQNVQQWTEPLQKLLQSGPGLETPPAAIDPRPRERFTKAAKLLREAVDELQRATLEASQSEVSITKERVELENQARQLRREIEALQHGAGSVVREAAALRQTRAQLQSLDGVLLSIESKLKQLIALRTDALNRLDDIRQQRFLSREQIAQRLNAALGPRIKVEVERAGNVEAYSSAILDALKGSGLKYTDLAPAIANNVSPRELVEAAEANDFGLIADTTGITQERAQRVLAQLRDSSLGEIATVNVEDDVSFQLLDGAEYKALLDLSTGQRCTVILPIVLEHKDRIVVVDQPEDHIDNAFIADTIVKAILQRTKEGQIVFTTHNANIPVLGNADAVIQMGSDGQRGFVLVSAKLDESEAVRAITGIMEGGREAFKKRAAFYSKHRA